MPKFTIHQFHHYGWTTNAYIADTFEEAAMLDLLKYHNWLPDYGHAVEFKDDRYIVSYAGDPYPPAYAHTHSAGMSNYWFGDRLHAGEVDDCPKCGGTGVNYYSSFYQCWECGDQTLRGLGSGKTSAQSSDGDR